jgi:hypothetical protein
MAPAPTFMEDPIGAVRRQLEQAAPATNARRASALICWRCNLASMGWTIPTSKRKTTYCLIYLSLVHFIKQCLNISTTVKIFELATNL